MVNVENPKPFSLEQITEAEDINRDKENKTSAELNDIGIGFHIPVREFKEKTVASLMFLYKAKTFIEDWIEEENVESIKNNLKSLEEELSSLYTTGIVALDESQKNPPVLVDYLGTLDHHIKENNVSKLVEELLSNVNKLQEDQKNLTPAEKDSMKYNRIARYLNSIKLITKDIKGEEVKLKDSKYRLTEKQKVIDQNIKLTVLVERSVEYLNKIIDFTEEYKEMIPKPRSQNQIRFDIEELILERIIKLYEYLESTLTKEYHNLINNMDKNTDLKKWTAILNQYSEETKLEIYKNEENNIQRNLTPEGKEYFNNISNMLNFSFKRIELILNNYTSASNEQHK